MLTTFEITEMLKPNLRDELEMVFQNIEHLQTLSKHLSRRLRQAMVHLESQKEGLQRVPLTDEEVRQLLRLNRRLSTIETFSNAFCSELKCNIEQHISDPAHPLEDFEIEVELQHRLSASDPDYETSDDNLLTQQNHIWEVEADSVDWRTVCRHEELNTEPHCYLFHDLYSHGGRNFFPKMTPRECLRIGSISVDVVVTYQFEMDLETGKWIKRSTPQSQAITSTLNHENGA